MLADQLYDYIAAAFAGIWVRTFEQPEALLEIAAVCKREKWHLMQWDADRGMTVQGESIGGSGPMADPLAALKTFRSADIKAESALLVLPNFHRFIGSTEVMQTLANSIATGKLSRRFILVLSPVVEIPTELEKLFVVVDHDLPSRPQLEQIARSIGTKPGDLPEGPELGRLIDAAAGLTRYEAEGAFSLSLVQHEAIRPEAVWELKSGLLKKAGILELHRGQERFADLGGLDAVKGFCSRTLTRSRGSARPRGVLLLGVPGTGKSAFAKALGSEVGRPTLFIDIASMFGKFIGQSEGNIRRALQIADAMAPCILFADEIEKGLAGARSSGETDSGVSARLFGSMLTWLSDHTSDVFFIGTCNDISLLPMEFSRAERFDGIFFLDLPGSEERAKIWPLHRARYGIPESDKLPDDEGWTGAEIQSCCRLAALLDMPLREAAANVVPVSRMAGQSVDRLRDWARGRCLDASKGGIYGHAQGDTSAATQRRRVVRPGV